MEDRLGATKALHQVPMHAETSPLSPQAAAALIAWFRDAGIDALVSEAPRDRFAETAAEAAERAERPAHPPTPEGRAAVAVPAGSPAQPAERALPQGEAEAGGAFPATAVAVPDEIAIADARERAASAATLDELRETLAGFTSCNLRLTASSLVFGDGDPQADLMLIGEAPGREEDLAGHPFVGRSGQFLNRMLEAIGLERDRVRVTNTVPWRPPGNRAPTPAENEICRPFLTRHIELVRPKVLICLGSPSAKMVLQTQEGILRLRGRWTSYSFGLGPGETIPAMAMLHPAYLLRQPAQKRHAWRDLLSLKEKLDALAAGSA